MFQLRTIGSNDRIRTALIDITNLVFDQMYHCKTQPVYRLLQVATFTLLSFFISTTAAHAQTDFAPGQIMFTGYNSDDPDGFSIVLLSDVLDGTIIYITDRGWSSTTGFRDDNDGEGTI